MTPDNVASHAVFCKFALSNACAFQLHENWMPESCFPSTAPAPPEHLYCIGPLSPESLLCPTVDAVPLLSPPKALLDQLQQLGPSRFPSHAALPNKQTAGLLER